jgi:hypothetical protein
LILIQLINRRLFLKSIIEHGIGKWQKLSRELVTMRIASHYQKYAIRQAKLDRNQCKRLSIHDINANTTSCAADDRGDDKPAATAAAAAVEAESRTIDAEPVDQDEVAVGDVHGTTLANN